VGGRVRRREVIPEDTMIRAVLNDPKIVQGRFGRQLEANVRVKLGEYKGTEFTNWFSFSKDKDTEEEYILYGGPLYDALAMVEPELDDVLDDENLSEKDYQKFLKGAAAKLDGLEIQARVGVRSPKNDPEKKRNFLQPGSIGLAGDPEEVTADLQF
jgi:hypothetical protein